MTYYMECQGGSYLISHHRCLSPSLIPLFYHSCQIYHSTCTKWPSPQMYSEQVRKYIINQNYPGYDSWDVLKSTHKYKCPACRLFVFMRTGSVSNHGLFLLELFSAFPRCRFTEIMDVKRSWL